MPPSSDDVVAPDELLYRRIPVSTGWYEPSSDSLSPHGFRIHDTRDIDGISVDRAKSDAHPDFRTPEESATGLSPEGYFVAVLRAGDLLSHGIDIEPMPEPDNPGHAVLPQLCSAEKKSDATVEIQQLLAEKLTLKVLGPYSGVS